MWVVGRHPVEELLASKRQRARKVLLSDAVTPDVRKALAALAAPGGIPCLVCGKEEWRRRTGEAEGAGVAAEIGEYLYADIAEWLATLPEKTLVLLLDGVTDPQNLGAILRNARAFGAGGVVVPRDRSCPVTGAVFRASAGAAAHVPVVQVTNLVRAIDELKEAGFWVYAAVEEGETDLSAFRPAPRTGLVLGGEEAGIRKLVREKCDGSVRIPMARGVDSLNVAVASGILAYAVRRASETRPQDNRPSENR